MKQGSINYAFEASAHHICLFNVRQKMNKGSKAIATALAIVGPPILGMLSAELSYVFHWSEPRWLFVVFYAFPQIGAFVFLSRTISWPWWIKCLAAVPFLALSLAVTIYACLMVAAANGDGL
ncbi:MAG TPA: hypothetical protein VK717_07230 [Opitutaceae bacterium]|jgi:hypothetical protein|nr:hypothetical protein [Opitutaceae bacterium]